MQRDLLLKLLESGEKVSIYSPQFVDEEYSEFEKFLLAYMNEPDFGEDLGVIMARLEVIKDWASRTGSSASKADALTEYMLCRHIWSPRDYVCIVFASVVKCWFLAMVA